MVAVVTRKAGCYRGGGKVIIDKNGETNSFKMMVFKINIEQLDEIEILKSVNLEAIWLMRHRGLFFRCIELASHKPIERMIPNLEPVKRLHFIYIGPIQRSYLVILFHGAYLDSKSTVQGVGYCWFIYWVAILYSRSQLQLKWDKALSVCCSVMIGFERVLECPLQGAEGPFQKVAQTLRLFLTTFIATRSTTAARFPSSIPWFEWFDDIIVELVEALEK